MSFRLFIGVLALILGASSFVYVYAQKDDAACHLDDNYREANQENLTAFLRIFAFLGNDGVWDAYPETIGLYYRLLASMRTFYDDADADLPFCAHPINDQYIAVIIHMNDVLAYNWAIQAYPDESIYISRANEAKQELNTAWQQLSDLNEALILND